MVYKQKIRMPVDAETTARELHRIAASNGGVLDPQDVVEASRDEGAVLHSLFEWDDTIAAEKYRVVQAKFIIRNITVEEVGEPEIRAFSSVGNREYVQTRTALSQADMRKVILQNALADIQAFQAKYRSLTQVAGLIAEMEKTVEQLKLEVS